MANRKETNETPTEQFEEQEIKPAPQNKNNKPALIHLLSVAAGILVLGILIFALISLQHSKKIQQELSDNQQRLLMLTNQLKQNLTSNQEQIDTKTNNLEQTQSQLQEQFKQIQQQLQTAVKQRLYQNQDWLLLKAQYYIELAQINAHWSDNFKTSIVLLSQADTLLKQLNDPKVLQIRQIIAKEINALNEAPSLDIAGLLSQLDAAQISITKLTIKPVAPDNLATETVETTKDTTSSTWRTRLQQSMNFLGKLVVIRRNNENIEPLISPLYESALKESIRLNLQEAQWAILNNNSIVYQLALKQAISNIQRSFNQQETTTLSLLKQLQGLQKIQLSKIKPEVGLALPLLNDLIKQNEAELQSTDQDKTGESE